jgi:hypothetical protein
MNEVYDNVKCGTWVSRTANIDYLVVAGGGGGGFDTGGGGGAGGYRASGYGPSPLQGSAQELSLGTYAVTVGAGGTAGTSCTCITAPNGSDSIFGTITSAGGGGAGRGGSAVNSADGGSGGGGAGHPSSGRCGGAGNTPSVDPSQGNSGGKVAVELVHLLMVMQAVRVSWSLEHLQVQEFYLQHVVYVHQLHLLMVQL